MHNRYALRPDETGYTLLDRLTGEPAVIASLSQKGLSREDAEHTLVLLNQHAAAATDQAAPRNA